MAVNINKLSRSYRRYMKKYDPMIKHAIRIMDTLPQRQAIRNIAAISFDAGYKAAELDRHEGIDKWKAPTKNTLQPMTPMSGTTRWRPKG